MTDEALMLAVRSGDVSALGILFERYHAALFDFLSRVTGDRTAAEDMVQDVFVRILKYRATYRDEGSFETWVFRIARNALADYFRKRTVAGPLGGEVLDGEVLERPEPSAGPLWQLEVHRDQARLKRALMRLGDDRPHARRADLNYFVI